VDCTVLGPKNLQENRPKKKNTPKKPKEQRCQTNRADTGEMYGGLNSNKETWNKGEKPTKSHKIKKTRYREAPLKHETKKGLPKRLEGKMRRTGWVRVGFRHGGLKEGRKNTGGDLKMESFEQSQGLKKNP